MVLISSYRRSRAQSYILKSVFRSAMSSEKQSATKQNKIAGATKLACATKLTGVKKLLKHGSGFGFLQMKSAMRWEEAVGG